MFQEKNSRSRGILCPSQILIVFGYCCVKMKLGYCFKVIGDIVTARLCIVMKWEGWITLMGGEGHLVNDNSNTYG